MKKKLLMCTLMFQTSSVLFAQNSRSDINSLLSSWVAPVVGFGILLGFLGLVIQNFDAIRGKNGLSKQDGWLAVGEGIIYVVLVISAIVFVASKVAGINFTV